MQDGSSSRFFAVPSRRGSFFRLKSDHRACGVAPSVGMRDGQANELRTPRILTTSMADRGEHREASGAIEPLVHGPLTGRQFL